MDEKSIEIASFLDETGRLTALPKKQRKRRAALEYLAGKFEPGRSYTEKEVNEICRSWHTFNDHFLVRRSLVDARLLGREDDGSRYWKSTPQPPC